MDIKIKDNDIKFKVRVSGIIVVDNKILVDTYTDNSYCLPGGYVHLGETSKDAVKREVEEETTMEVKVDKLLGIMENFYINNKNDKTHSIDFFYKVLPNKNILLKDYEYLENDNNYEILHKFKWLDIDVLDNYNLLPREIVKYLKNNDKNIFYEIIKEDNFNK